MRFSPWHAVLALIFVLLSGPAFPEPATTPILLRYASPYSSTHPFSLADRDWIEYIHTKSNGQLLIEPYWAGSLISADESILELRHGVADVSYIAPIYTRAGMRANRAQTAFYDGIQSIDHQVMLLHCLREKFPVFDQELEGVVPLAAQGGNQVYVLTKKTPIIRLEDFAGLRIRAPTEYIPVLTRLGADAVFMPMGDVYTALSKGIIDGVLTAPDGLTAMHFAEIAEVYSLVRFSRGAYTARAISSKTFSLLKPDYQRLMLESGAYWEERLAHHIGRAGDAGIRYAHESGMTIVEVDPAEQARVDEVFDKEVRKAAEELNEIGIDGHRIYSTARDLSADIVNGQSLNCESTI
jgi:TRAP-type C4-dicarboxylate transport system substrate-binding protein